MRDFGVAALPILSIVDPNTLQTKTDAEWINYEVLKLDSDYEIITDWTRIEPEAERTFSLMLEPDDKTLWQARLELPNLSEIWIYYYSAAHYDIGIESNRQFFISKPKPKEHFLFTVFNDGIKKAEDISVYLKVDGKNYGPKRKIKELESGYYKTVYFSVSGLLSETTRLRLRHHLPRKTSSRRTIPSRESLLSHQRRRPKLLY